MEFTTEKDRLVKAINSIRRRGAYLDQAIWSTAVGCVAHAQEHGDVTLFGDLVSAMPNGSRVERLIQWVQYAAPIMLVDGKGAKVDKSRVKSGEFYADRSNWNISFLEENNWVEFKRASQASEFDLVALERQLNNIAKEKGKREYTAEAVAAAEALLVALAEFKQHHDLSEETLVATVRKAA